MNWLRTIKRRAYALLTSPGQELGRGMRFLQFQVRLWYFCIRRLGENNAMAMSAALSFRTIFAMVPTIVLGVVALKSFGALDSSKAALRQLLEESGFTVIRVVTTKDDARGPTTTTAPAQPASAPADREADEAVLPPDAQEDETVDVVGKIEEVVARVEGRLTFGRLGPIGVALLIWTALTLMSTLERSLNRIFGAPRPRSLGRRILLYWSALTLGPLAFGLAAYAGDVVVAFFERVGGLGWILVVLGWAQPIVVGVLLLAGLYVLMPNTTVGVKAAFGGALVAVPIWLAAKWGFQLYVTRVVGTDPLYGSLGLLPLFLMWLNLSWWIFLFGAEIAHTASHLGRWAFAEHVERTFLGPWELLATALAIAGRFAAQGGASTVSHLAERLGLPPASTQGLLDRLSERGTICRVEREGEPAYVPTRPPEGIEVTDVLALASDDEDDEAALQFQGDLRHLVERVRRTAHDALAGTTLADLLNASPGAETHT